VALNKLSSLAESDELTKSGVQLWCQRRSTCSNTHIGTCIARDSKKHMKRKCTSGMPDPAD